MLGQQRTGFHESLWAVGNGQRCDKLLPQQDPDKSRKSKIAIVACGNFSINAGILRISSTLKLDDETMLFPVFLQFLSGIFPWPLAHTHTCHPYTHEPGWTSTKEPFLNSKVPIKSLHLAKYIPNACLQLLTFYWGFTEGCGLLELGQPSICQYILSGGREHAKSKLASKTIRTT